MHRSLLLLALASALTLASCSDDEATPAQPVMNDEADAAPDAPLDDTSDDNANNTREGDTGEPPDADPDTPEDVAEDVPILTASSYGYGEPGSHPVGRITLELVDADRERTLRVEVWYPAVEEARAEAAAGVPMETLVPDPDDRATYEALLAAAPMGCPTRTSYTALDATPATAESAAGWPVVFYSHCFQCLRLSASTVAEHLASRGIVVAAPDHTGDTVFEQQDGDPGDLSDAFLQVRAADIIAVMDHLLGEDAPEAIRGSLDVDRVGMMGHSFGAVTTGRVLQLDPRPRAGLALAAPMENLLFPSVELSEIDAPVMWLLAEEDNSIGEIGNVIIRQNFDQANPPAWKVEVADAGHWSFSDLCGLTEAFLPGCGEGERQTAPGEAFTFIPVPDGLEIARRYSATFFAAHLLGDAEALDALEEAFPSLTVTTDARVE